MEQRVVEVVPSIVNAERNKRRFFVLDDADIQQYLDSEGGLNDTKNLYGIQLLIQ
jgi:hypothetical protein